MNGKVIANAKVTAIKEGFCFLDKVFCHVSKFKEHNFDFSKLKVGTEIEYEEMETEKGKQVKKILRIEENGNSHPQGVVQEKSTQNHFFIEKFSDESGNIDPALISGDEKYPNNVKKMAENLKKTNLTSTQLRRFYDEVLGYDNEQISLEQKKTKLQMLVAKVAYSVGRKVLPEDFLDFFRNRVDCIQNEQDFEFFLQHFEAFVAWFKYEEYKKEAEEAKIKKQNQNQKKY